MTDRALSSPRVYDVPMDPVTPSVDVERILALHRAGRHRGLPPGAGCRAEVRSTFCGDRLELGLTVEDGRITAAGFDGDLCSVAAAAASVLCEDLVGRPLADAAALSASHAAALLGVPLIRARRPCAELPMLALQQAVRAEAAP